MQKKEAVIVVATETLGTQHSLPGSVVRPDAGVEFTKDILLVHLRHSRQQGVQVLVEFVLRRIRARYWGSVGADDGGELVSPKRQAEAHQAIIDILRQIEQTTQDVVPHSKGKTSVASLCLLPAAPEEGEAGTHLLQLTLLKESGLAKSSNAHLLARHF
ncbi:unnamed protein product [Schistocephalus solidus]|uniref:Uncharacterized protein n=1 Tax=Schistocephalus solidus TaxID=70667 RepID=A0A3P7DRN2_SCHSO|nr:unnamed protein product [Schistocephalus solidus]